MSFSLYASYIQMGALLCSRDAASLLPSKIVCFSFSEDSFLGFLSCLLKTKRPQGEVANFETVLFSLDSDSARVV
ncbi:hypothetical protein A9255_05465 [Xenorhabdus hominickii]|uniref:Uncharacterized protein n=1 Tax=Xenorhabdus hominickii TaxID=351679 RepID=A0A2G0Q501_XENHO|nr:hypothetical protein A9255_05465 [Xenorhabdus hominickii]PHM54295.1 hypothetical protein Xhom_03372 [Xenorhabdus hominickii]